MLVSGLARLLPPSFRRRSNSVNSDTGDGKADVDVDVEVDADVEGQHGALKSRLRY